MLPLNKTSFFAIIMLFFSIPLSSQENLAEIFQASNNYNAIIKQGEKYFKQKHPTVSFSQLTEGEYRDGEYVKFLRWQSFWRNSLNADGTLGDISAYWREKSQQKASGRNSNNSPYQTVEWTNLSYENYIRGQIGLGRTTSMAFHPTNPDIFYVGAAIGGIWKTTDGGQTYMPLGDDLPLLAVSSIIVNKDNPDIIYIGISDHLWYGLPGIGVYKSIDGGLTWNATDLSFNMGDNIRIYQIEVDPTDVNKMFVATQNGLYQTTNGFDTVTKINTINSSHVKINLGNSNIVYLTSNNGEFLKSTNGGATFSLVQDFGNGSLYPALTALNTSKIYLRHQNTLYKSTDNGSTFSATTNAFGRQNNVLHFAPTNQQVLLTGDFNIQRSDDDGASFYPISHWLGEGNLPLIHVDQRNIFHNPLETDYIYFCNDGGVYRYIVSSNQFENLSNGLLITQFYDIAVSQTDKNIISGGSQDNGNVYRDSDGTWYDYDWTGDGMNQAINPINANIRYWSYQFGSLNRWENGQNTSIIPPIQAEEKGAWEMPYRLAPDNPNRIIAGYERVYESLDKGNNWTDISGNIFGGSLHELAIAKTNTNRIYVTRNSTLFVKDTLSNNWTAKNMPSFISDLEVAPDDANTIYITTPGFTTGSKVYKSTNAGDTWTNISGSLPNVSTDAIEIYEGMPEGLFVGTDAGVYYRDGHSVDWIEYGALPHTRVEDIEIQYSEKLIRVGTHGRGVLEAPIIVTACEITSPDADSDGVCDAEDTCPNFDDNLIGMPCDDGNPQTFGEYYTIDCNCEEAPSSITYCPGAGASGTGSDWISNVSFHTIDNSSGQTGYSDFRQQSTSLMPDSSYNLKVTINYSFSLDTTYAWIDWDTNGVFEANELISMPTGVGHDYLNEATVTVPSGIGPLVTTMRVRVSYGDRDPAEPCGDIYGEVEDYTIRVLPAPITSTVMDFDGIDDYIDINDGLLNNMTNFTIETWFYYEESPTSHYSLFDLGKDWNARINMQIKPNEFTFQISNWDWENNRPVGSVIESEIMPCPGSWHHAAISYESNTRTAIFYLNGIEVGMKENIAVEPRDLFADDESYIGRSHDYQNNTYFKGKMDEFRIWNYTRSAAEINATKDIPLMPRESGMRTYYDFEKGIPAGDNTAIHQISGSSEFHFDATLHGFSLLGPASNFVEATLITSCDEPIIASDNTVMDFDGIDDFLKIKPGLLDTISDFTIETWLYLDHEPEHHYVIWGLGTTQSRIFLGITPSLFRFRIVERGGSEEITSDIDSDVVPSYNAWHHVAVTYHSADKTATLYLDGTVLGVNMDMQLEPKDLTPTDSLFIGNTKSRSNILNNLDGKIDEFRFWSYARSPEELEVYRNCSPVSTEAGLLVHYNFEDGIQNGDNSSQTQITNNTPADYPADLLGFSLSGGKSNYTGASSTFIDTISCEEPIIVSDNTVMDFDGVDDFLKIKQGLLDTISDFTIETWLYIDHEPEHHYVIWGLGTTQSRIFLGITPSLFRFRIVERGGSEEITSDIDSDVVPSYNAWHHVAVTYHSADKTATLYLDGTVLGVNMDMQLEPKDLTPTDSLFIGNTKSRSNTLNNLDGKIDEFRFWSYARSPEELEAYRNCSPVSTEAGLLVHYNFEDGIQNGDNSSQTQVTNNTPADYPADLFGFSLSGGKSNYTGASTEFIDKNCPSIDLQNCQLEVLQVNGSTNNSGLYHGIDSLYATAIIPKDSMLTFKAGKVIVLNPGFYAQKGAAVTMQIEACNLSTITPESPTVTTPTQLKTVLEKKAKLQMQISPNPFRQEANIRVYLPEATTTYLSIVNLNQQTLVKQKIDNEKGWFQTTLDASQLRPGIYFVSLQTATQRITQKVILMQ